MAVYERSWFQNLEMAAKNDIKNDPCFYEGKASMKCVIDNAGDKTQCQQYFDSYKKCKKFWYDVYVGRRRADLTPYLPPVDQRQEYLQKYVQQKKSQYRLMMIRPNDDLP